MSAKEIARALAERTEAVCQYLLPRGKKIGNEYCVGSIQGNEGNSLKVHLVGDKAGVWCDFNAGDGGDLVNLWVAIRSVDLSTALKEAREYLGLGGTRFEAYKPFKFKKPDQKKQLTLSPSSDVYCYLTDQRKLLPEILAAFKVVQEGRTIVFPYIRSDEIFQIKYIKLDRDENGKKVAWTEKDCAPCLFGWSLIPSNARSVVICEGEIDAMSLYQYGLPALSVPFGAGKGGKHKWLEYEFERLSIFDEIFLCFDQDSAGKDAISELIERLGRHRCRIVLLPHKDPNACLQAGVTREQMHDAFKSAQTRDPEELRQASTLVEKVINEFYPVEGTILGYVPPWEKAWDKIVFRPSELSIWSGINGHGKSQLLGQVMLHLMKQNARICVASLELKPQKLLMRLTRQAGGVAEPAIDYIRVIHQWYEDKLWLFDLVGTAKADRLLEVFLYARQRYGIDVFVIDSFLKLDIAEDDFKAQKSFIEKLCDFKNEHNCQIHLVVHPRKASDESQAPGKLDNKGTGAISDLADNCFAIWRNKAKEELKRRHANGATLTLQEQEKLNTPDCFWICDKNRNGEWEGRFALWFEPKSFQYLNHESQRALQYVDYSNVVKA